MAWAPIFTQVLREGFAPQHAVLRDFALVGDPRECFPELRSHSGSVDGILLENVDDATLQRVTALHAGLGAAPQTGRVTVDGHTLQAMFFVASAPEPNHQPLWDVQRWQEKWAQVAQFAVEEALQHVGYVSDGALRQMMPMILVRAHARATAAQGVPTDVRSAMHADQVEVVERRNRHAGFFLTREYLLKHPTFGGALSPPLRREVFVATDAAIVLPYDPVRDRVLLVEQFRMGPFGRGDPHPWMLEPVAGRVDPGEDPEETARRECVEEAGLALAHLEHISSHYCSLGCSTEYFHCYIGLCDLPDIATGQGGLESEDEDIRTHVLSFERAMDLIPSGEAANGPLILSLLWLQRERDRLRAPAG